MSLEFVGFWKEVAEKRESCCQLGCAKMAFAIFEEIGEETSPYCREHAESLMKKAPDYYRSVWRWTILNY